MTKAEEFERRLSPVSFFLMSLMSLATRPSPRMSCLMSFSEMCWARPLTMMVLFGAMSSSPLKN